MHNDDTGAEIIKGFTIVKSNWLSMEELEAILEKFRPEVSIVDSYLAKEEIYLKIEEGSEKLVCIDDTLRIKYPEGSTIVNPGIVGTKLPYNKELYKTLVGAEYAILRKPFLVEKKPREIKSMVHNVLITTGGEDKHNLTPAFFQEVRKEYPHAKCSIVVGPSFTNKDKIDSVIDIQTELILSPDAEQMCSAMEQADLAITAGGQTIYELSKMEVPMIVYLSAENQQGNIDGFTEYGISFNIGKPSDSSFFDKLRNALKEYSSKEIRAHRSEQGKKLIDGNGVKRIVESIQDYTIFTSFRKAEEEDVNLYYEWANDALVRNLSYNKNPIPFESHKRWFDNRIKNPNCMLLLFMNRKNIPIGQVRIEPDPSQDFSIISVSIAKEFRGRGYGSEILQKASDYYLTQKDSKPIYAFIFKANEASIKSFEKAGFIFEKEEIIEQTPSVVLIKRR